MTINWWTLGLQAVNVLILVWLLSRVFWRPVAKAIAARQDAAQSMLNDAKSAQTSADAALAEVTKTREGMATEREALLAEAKTKGEAAAKAARAEASDKAETLLKTEKLASQRKSAAARDSNAADSALLAVDIARKLLARLDNSDIQAPFLDLLVKSLEQLPVNDKEALVATKGGISLVSAIELDDAAKAKITHQVGQALGSEPTLEFLIDHDLIAGFELHTSHFVLRNSWQSDLSAILKELKNAA